MITNLGEQQVVLDKREEQRDGAFPAAKEGTDAKAGDTELDMEAFDNHPDHEMLITQIYAARQPAKLPELPKLFQKYRRLPGGLKVMLDKVHVKYLMTDASGPSEHENREDDAREGGGLPPRDGGAACPRHRASYPAPDGEAPDSGLPPREGAASCPRDRASSPGAETEHGRKAPLPGCPREVGRNAPLRMDSEHVMPERELFLELCYTMIDGESVTLLPEDASLPQATDIWLRHSDASIASIGMDQLHLDKIEASMHAWRARMSILSSQLVDDGGGGGAATG